MITCLNEKTKRKARITYDTLITPGAPSDSAPRTVSRHRSVILTARATIEAAVHPRWGRDNGAQEQCGRDGRVRDADGLPHHLRTTSADSSPPRSSCSSTPRASITWSRSRASVRTVSSFDVCQRSWTRSMSVRSDEQSSAARSRSMRAILLLTVGAHWSATEGSCPQRHHDPRGVDPRR